MIDKCMWTFNKWVDSLKKYFRVGGPYLKGDEMSLYNSSTWEAVSHSCD